MGRSRREFEAAKRGESKMMTNEHLPKIDEIKKASEVLGKMLSATPLVRSEALSDLYNCNVFLKLETAQPIGSFKIRGATYKISKTSTSQRELGLVAASAGNHAQGVAWGGKMFGSKVTIVMPETAPLNKILSTQRLGAEVILSGKNYDESYTVAKELVQKQNKTYVHAFLDRDVIAGQGTVAMEILEQCPEVDFVVSSLGGGGLATGIGVVLKTLKPETKLIVCQAENAPAMASSLKSGKVISPEFKGSFADGISVKEASPEMFQVLKPLVDEVFTSDEQEIAMNTLRLMEVARVVAEGSAAITLGALDRYASLMQGKNVVLVISGGNIDVNLVSRIIDQGLIRSGRRLKLKVQILDRPGSLAQLTQLLGGLKVNILQAIHDRSHSAMRLDETEVELMLETRGPEHSAEVILALEKYCSKVISRI